MKKSKTSEDAPIILNLFSPTNFGEYKFVPLIPANFIGLMNSPFIGARFEEINLHLEGEHPNRWRRVVNGICLDNSDEYVQKFTLSKTEVHSSIVEEVKRARTYIKTIREISDADKYKAITSREYTKDMKDTVRHRSYTMWYAYVMTAVNLKGETMNEYQGKLCLMTAPHSLMNKLLRQFEEFSTLLAKDQRMKMRKIMEGMNKCTGNSLRLSITGPGRKDSSLSPVLNEVEGEECSLIEEKVYKDLKNPITYFAGGTSENLFNIYDVKKVLDVLNERVALYNQGKS